MASGVPFAPYFAPVKRKGCSWPADQVAGLPEIVTVEIDSLPTAEQALVDAHETAVKEPKGTLSIFALLPDHVRGLPTKVKVSPLLSEPRATHSVADGQDIELMKPAPEPKGKVKVLTFGVAVALVTEKLATRPC